MGEITFFETHFLNLFEVTLDSYKSILLASICFSKLLKDYSRAAEKKLNLSVTLEYVLLVHTSLLEYS
jgi:hypothetical protein